ncbi:Kappa-type opioid receptor [Desmophyllum pertusum]|uniref:Kappa-type opioid receptor n=1 Tax=Desmophyllum pertusum TaxID=174260 RepID=A0A9X0CYM6_9CNID|nr:Kappa-type opioid receptor [Desmophyllum pertusum]
MLMSRLVFLILASCEMWISIAESQRENTSNHNETEPGDPQDFPEIIYSFPTKVIFTSAMLFTFLVSVVGNSLVIYVITKHHSMRTSTNCLIMNLAICDLLLTVIQTPYYTSHLYIGDTWFGGTVGNVTFKITAYLLSMLLFCSILNLVAIAIDRFLAVTRQ